MSRPDITECDSCVAPAEAFSVVGNETRLSILEALWRADDRPVRFSDLRETVGMRDSAQFNYHLQQLTGQFVTNTDDGYDLRYAGEKVVHAVVAGEFNQSPEWGPHELDDDCVACGSPLVATYEDESIAIECSECRHPHGEYPFPPGGLTDRGRDEVVRAFDQRVRHLHCLAADGVCPECSGKMTSYVEREGDCCIGSDVRVEHVCEQCGHSLCSAIGLVLLDQADVVHFHREHGVDLNATPYWRLPWCVSDRGTTVESTDPLEVTVTLELGGERLKVTIDDDLAVDEVDRTDAIPADD